MPTPYNTPALPPLHAARWPQIQDAARHLLILPIGSTEQHGPHLPLSTDTVIATELARAAAKTYPEIGLAPALPFGASGEHAHFPGTLSIGTQALELLVVEFVRHASMTWKHVLVVNGHGGNADALQSASNLVRHEGRSLTLWHAASAGPRTDAHAGYRETSLMLYLRPDMVRMDLAVVGAIEPLPQLLDEIRARGVKAVSQTGILGDPTGATAAVGAEIFSQMLDRLIAAIRSVDTASPHQHPAGPV